jgi:hypothetical protein
MHGRTYSGIVSLDARCTPPEPCKTRVMAPSQLGWLGPTTEEFKGKSERFLKRNCGRPSPITITCSPSTTDTNEQFTTYLVTTNEGRPIFEPMLWWSPGEKKCGERPLPTVAQETSFEWNGYVENAFGVEIISWKGHATYSYQNGTADLPEQVMSQHRTRYIPASGQRLKTQAFANRQPEEALLTYQIIWSVAFPKMDFDKFKLELPPLGGNAIAGSYAYRGDGTWNKVTRNRQPRSGAGSFQASTVEAAQQNGHFRRSALLQVIFVPWSVPRISVGFGRPDDHCPPKASLGLIRARPLSERGVGVI